MHLQAVVDAAALSPPDLAPRALAHGVLAQPRAALDAVATFLGAPTIELAASPISARVAVGAANRGQAFVHQEHRLSPMRSPATSPELDAGLGPQEAATPEVWQDGILHLPKYFSAFLEAPLATFHPVHRGKWRPHELLHRLSRFAWRPDITRFEAYLSARLSELLPVVHWYGFDEIGRFRCPSHRGQRPDRTVCAACERGLVPYWEVERDEVGAESAAAHALEHLKTELDASAQELERGQVCPTKRPGLDASSDAVGYLRGHWNRITAWSFGAWIERFAQPEHDVFDTCGAQLEHVRTLAASLLHEPWVLEPEFVRVQQRTRRWVSDIGYRVLLHLEALDSDVAEDILLPALDQLATTATTATSAITEQQQVEASVAELFERLRHLSPDTAERTISGGWSWRTPEEGCAPMLSTGLRSALPRSLAGINDKVLGRWSLAFAAQDAPVGLELASRFARYVEANTGNDLPPLDTEAIRFEAWLRAPARIDLEAERFAALPETSGAQGRVRLNATWREGTFRGDAIARVLGDDESGEPPESQAHAERVAAVHWSGTPRVIEVDKATAWAVEEAKGGRLPPGDAGQNLLENGFIVWFPAVR